MNKRAESVAKKLERAVALMRRADDMVSELVELFEQNNEQDAISVIAEASIALDQNASELEGLAEEVRADVYELGPRKYMY